MDKLLHNPLDVWKEGAQKWGENIMQSVIESVFANQDKGLTQLQELQKWNVVKLIQKIITTKLFVRETPFVPIRDSPLLNAADNCLQPPLRSVTGEKLFAIGRLSLRLDCAESLLLQSCKHIDTKTAKKIVWKAVIRTGNHTAESEKVLLTDPLFDVDPDPTAPMLTALKWPAKDLNLGDIYDLQTDVVIELHRKLVREALPPGGLDFSVNVDEYAMSDLSALFGQKRINLPEPHADHRDVVSPHREERREDGSEGLLPPLHTHRLSPESSTNLPSVPVGTDENNTLWKDLENASGTKLIPNCWQLYGIVIIPLASVIHTAELDRKSSTVRTFATKTRKDADGEQIELDGWFHLYPPNQRTRELKFLRPCSGYPGIGMSNPRISLGMLRLNLKFFIKDTYSRFWLTPLISNLNRPAHVWRLASKLDLQVLENVGLRTHQAALKKPRWTPIFIQPSRILEIWRSNKESKWTKLAYPGAFWLILIHATLLAPLYFIPIEIGILILLVSHSYRGQMTEGVSSGAYYPLDHHFLPCSKSGFKVKPAPLPNDFFPSAMGIKSARMKDVSKWMELNPLHLGTVRAPNLDVPIKQTLLKKNISWIESVREESAEIPNAHAIPSMHFPVASHSASSIGSVFGRLDISVTDPTSFIPVYPIFSDDVAELNLYDLKHLGMMVLEAVQFILSLTATVTEKLKCAYNWSDPSLSRIAWLLTCVLCIEASVFLWILSRLPIVMIRAIFLLVPLVTLFTLGDPQIFASIGLARYFDNFAYKIAEWQPESQLCLRICVDIWDSLFGNGLLTVAERTERMEKLEDLVAGKKSLISDDSKGPAADSPLSGAENMRTPTEGKMLSPHRRHVSAQVELNRSGISVTPRRNAGIVGVHSAGAVFRFSTLSSEEEYMTRRKQGVRIIRECAICLISNMLLKPLLVQIRYIMFLLYRLPDRRELEHRAIAATQYLAPDLSPLLQAHLGRTDIDEGNGELLSQHIRKTYTTFCKPHKGHNGLSSVWSSSTLGKSAVPTTVKEPVRVQESSSQMRFARNLLSKGLSFRNSIGEEDAWYTAAGAKKNMESMLKRLTTDSRRSHVEKTDSSAAVVSDQHEESFETVCDPATDTDENGEHKQPHCSNSSKRLRSMSFESPNKLSTKVLIHSKRRPDSLSPDKHRRVRKR